MTLVNRGRANPGLVKGLAGIEERIGDRAPKSVYDRVFVELGLDRPLYEQFWIYLHKVFTGDFGESFLTKRPIIDDIMERFPRTLLLASTAMLLAIISGLTIGVLAAVRPNGWFDRLAVAITYLGISFPVYWIGLLLIVVFAVTLRLSLIHISEPTRPY